MLKNHKNLEKIEEEINKRLVKKDKRKKVRMKVSGKNVFKLKEIIRKKSNRP
jgi:hypothetical protein